MRERISNYMVCAFLLMLCLAGPIGPARAATVTDRPLIDAFDGSGSTAGRFIRPFRLAVDNSTGFVYVSEETGGHNAVSRFDADGNPAPFPATGTSSLTGSPGKPFEATQTVAVDNSGTATQGRIYVGDFGDQALKIFAPSGEFLCEARPSELGFEQPIDVAVDETGQAWAVSASGFGEVARLPAGGCSGGKAPLKAPPPEPDRVIELDANGNVYLVQESKLNRYPPPQFTNPPTIVDSGPVRDAFADQSSPSGHIFSLHKEDFNEYDSSGALLGLYGQGGEIDLGRGIAYNPTLGRVYVADEGLHEVDMLGPVATGTVPDATIEASDEVGIGKATFHGTIDPQGVANGYYFEWTADPHGWFDVERSPEQGLPADNSPHPVSFTATTLSGNRNYRVRLVPINRQGGATDGLRLASGIDTFHTDQASEAPGVGIDPVQATPTPPCATGITATGACVSGEIDPQEDTVRWRLRLSTDPECKTGFNDQEAQILHGGETSSPQPVDFTLGGLVPAQHYCVRIFAENSFGATISSTEEFRAKAIPATEASTAFAAPRLDTSARINGKVNPQGAPLTYSFEYRRKGDSTWTESPTREVAVDARSQIVIGEELEGLAPNTAYEYRLATVENEAGPTLGLPGATREFTTRSTAEVQPPSPCPNEDVRIAQHTASYLGSCRAVELLNSPNKGNQNVSVEMEVETPPLSEDGERALWNVKGGAPGGNAGAGAAYLSRRTGPSATSPNGWASQAILPPAAQQFEGGEAGAYRLRATTPDLSSFIFDAGAGISAVGRTLVRLDTHQGQTVLKEYGKDLYSRAQADLTDDGAHVLFIDPISRQLEDIGTGKAELLSVMPDGLRSECGLLSSGFVGLNGGGANRVESASLFWRPGYHMIATADASRVYFQAKSNKADGTCNGNALDGIYVRDRTAGKVVKGKPEGQTTLIDPGTGGEPPHFIRASADGREALFLTRGACRSFSYPELTCESPETADTNSDSDVYRWDEASGESSCLTCVVQDADLLDNAGRNLVASDDFSHVYFESKRQLVPGEGVAGKTNLYVLSDGALRFVASGAESRESGSGVSSLALAQLSHDGKTLLFPAMGPAVDGKLITADRVASKCGNGSCEELYLYDDRTESIECVSCRQGGLTQAAIRAPGAPDSTVFRLSADGSTVAFTTSQTLVPQDINNGADVYTWRNGVLSLVSNGVTSFQRGLFASPQVRAVSADGRDVLFSLVDPGLTGFEQDGFANLYDARIDGGFTPPATPPGCEGDACQGPLQAPPAMPPSTTATFSGRGNLSEAPKACPRGKVRRRGRCQPRHPHRRGHSKGKKHRGQARGAKRGGSR